MKIIDISEFYAERGGGVRTYTHQKLRAAAATGIELVVVAPGPEDGEIHREGGRIRWVKGPPMPLDPRYYVLHRERAVHAILDQEQPDVVEGSSVWTAGWMAARWQGNARKVLVFHQDPVAVYPHTLLDRFLSPRRIDALCRPYWAYLRRLAAHFDETLVAGDWLAARLRGQRVPSPRAIPFGIDKGDGPLSPKAVAMARGRLLHACGVPSTGRLLVAISRHHPEKRLGTVIGAFAKAKERSKEPLGLVIFGDGPLRPWVARKAARVPGVHLAGFTTDRDALRCALGGADAFLHGSAAETFGLVVAEALVEGVPLIVPAAGGAGDLADPRWAETYAPGDEAAASAAILRCLSRPAERMREAARWAGVHRVRSTDAHFDALFSRYEAVAGRRRGRNGQAAAP